MYLCQKRKIPTYFEKHAKKKQKTAVRKKGSKNCGPLQGQQIQYEEVACGKHVTRSENLHCFLFEAVPMSNPRVEPSSARDLEEDVPFLIKRVLSRFSLNVLWSLFFALRFVGSFKKRSIPTIYKIGNVNI